ncbi:MAG: methyltransferase domain-containing protein [Planctomycetes bacterium]|nr:methyltransferase domain-containing protein [Planctomycetota bacterium]
MNTTIQAPSSMPDFAAIKTRQRAAWSSGDYARIGSTLQIVGEQLAERLAMRPDARVLDVAAGNGNITLAMARRWCRVTSTDYCEGLLERGRQRAQAEGLEVEFQVADAEQLPFADGTFDAVVSTFGVMFAPDQAAAARELLRVCRSGGRIGLANWTPGSFIGDLFRTIGRHVAPPAGLQSPARWGDRDWLATQFGAQAAEISIATQTFDFRYRSPQHFVDFFRAFYGPVEKAFLALDANGQAALEADLLALIARFDVAVDGTMRVPGEYVEVVITRR